MFAGWKREVWRARCVVIGQAVQQHRQHLMIVSLEASGEEPHQDLWDNSILFSTLTEVCVCVCYLAKGTYESAYLWTTSDTTNGHFCVCVCVFHTRWMPETDRNRRSKIKWCFSTTERKIKRMLCEKKPNQNIQGVCVCVGMCLCFSPRRLQTLSAQWRSTQKCSNERSSVLLVLNRTQSLMQTCSWKLRKTLVKNLIFVFSPASWRWQTLSPRRTWSSAVSTDQPGTWCWI